MLESDGGAKMQIQVTRDETSQTLMDHEAALRALGGEIDLLRSLAGIYLEDFNLLWREANAACEGGTAIVAHQKLHTIKGLSSTFFAKSVTDFVERLERIASSGETPSPQLMIKLKVLLDELAEELRSLPT